MMRFFFAIAEKRSTSFTEFIGSKNGAVRTNPHASLEKEVNKGEKLGTPLRIYVLTIQFISSQDAHTTICHYCLPVELVFNGIQCRD